MGKRSRRRVMKRRAVRRLKIRLRLDASVAKRGFGRWETSVVTAKIAYCLLN